MIFGRSWLEQSSTPWHFGCRWYGQAVRLGGPDGWEGERGEGRWWTGWRAAGVQVCLRASVRTYVRVLVTVFCLFVCYFRKCTAFFDCLAACLSVNTFFFVRYPALTIVSIILEFYNDRLSGTVCRNVAVWYRLFLLSLYGIGFPWVK